MIEQMVKALIDKESERFSHMGKRGRLALIGAIDIVVVTLGLLVITLTMQFSGDKRAPMGWLLTFSLALYFLVSLYLYVPETKMTATPRDRIVEARMHMDATGQLLRELEDELSTRTKILEQLQADAERYEQLASLNAEQAKAINDMVGQQFKRQSRATWWQWWGSIVLAAILGFIVNWASTPLLDFFTH